MLPMSSNAHSKDDKGTEERNGLRGRNRLGMENVSIFAYGVVFVFFFVFFFSFPVNSLLTNTNLFVLNKMVQLVSPYL